MGTGLPKNQPRIRGSKLQACPLAWTSLGLLFPNPSPTTLLQERFPGQMRVTTTWSEKNIIKISPGWGLWVISGFRQPTPIIGRFSAQPKPRTSYPTWLGPSPIPFQTFGWKRKCGDQKFCCLMDKKMGSQPNCALIMRIAIRQRAKFSPKSWFEMMMEG